jgi:hypothetical protein
MNDEFPVTIVSLEDFRRGSTNGRHEEFEERDRAQIEMLERRTETAERKVEILKQLFEEVLGMLDMETHAAVVLRINAVFKELRLKSTPNAENRRDTVGAQDSQSHEQEHEPTSLTKTNEASDRRACPPSAISNLRYGGRVVAPGFRVTIRRSNHAIEPTRWNAPR